MDAQIFLDNFARLAEAPGGVQRLRDLVVELAIQGRLVAQNPTDEPADTLLRSIEEARARAFKLDGWRTSKSAGPIHEVDKPFLCPLGWSWVRLESLALPQAGFAFKSNGFNQAGSGTPLIRIRDIANATTECHYEGEFRSEFLVRPGDYLIGMDGNFNIRRWAGPPALLNQRVTRLIFFSDEVEKPFVTWALQARINELHGSRAYTTVQHLSGKQIGAAVIPVPPLAEQKRIVAKVDDLLGLCDQLEIVQSRRKHATTRFRSSALHALTEAGSPDELRRAWERVSSNLSALTDHPNSIDDLRDTVRQLAVEGRLTPQDPDEEPASAILKACQERKRSLLQAGAVRGRPDLPEISTEESPYPIPSGWALARLDQWCDITGGVAKGRRLVGREVVTLPYLRVANVKSGYLLLDEVKTIDVLLDEVNRYSLQAGDVLLTEGGDWDKLGRSALWTGEIEPCLHQNHLFRARPLVKELLPDWVSLFTNSEAGRRYFQSKAKRTTNLASINMTELRSTPLPVPPVAEQRRILARLAEIDTLLARLESALTNARNEGTHMADAIARAG